MSEYTADKLIQDLGVPAEKLDKTCSNVQLAVIALTLPDWRALSPFLEISRTELEDIDHDGRTEQEKKVKLLWMWKKKESKKATYRRLIDALVNAQSVKHAEDVCKSLLSETGMLPSTVNTH